MANNVKTVLLLGLLTGVILFIGSFWGQQGLAIALVMSVMMNFASYFFSDKIALATYSAQPVTPEENPEVYRRVFPLVQNLVQKMNRQRGIRHPSFSGFWNFSALATISPCRGFISSRMHRPMPLQRAATRSTHR